ncbi:hypothetical protein HPT29_018405 [Microvirga terrae]|uniref:PH domain-containing protein n=1 Tax=Microvirga terrae TaxID=2740529 RepID=A0ABY5RQH7_9HYPH|nr:hypothetical protein [Microvirga terrae]UVF18447.1 hypothetical protein HPT29_018405 [Microvirga terrae]
MSSVEEPMILQAPRYRMAAVGSGMMALAILLLSDMPNIYDGLIRGDKFRWLLALPPMVRVSIMGGIAAINLIGSIYLLLWVLYAKPIKLSSAGVDAYPRIFWRSSISWGDADAIEVGKQYVNVRSKRGSSSSPVIRIPVRLARSSRDILEFIAQYRPDLTRPYLT